MTDTRRAVGLMRWPAAKSAARRHGFCGVGLPPRHAIAQHAEWRRAPTGTLLPRGRTHVACPQQSGARAQLRFRSGPFLFEHPERNIGADYSFSGGASEGTARSR